MFQSIEPLTVVYYNWGDLLHCQRPKSMILAVQKLSIVRSLAGGIAIVSKTWHSICNPQSLVVISIGEIVLTQSLAFAINHRANILSLIFVGEFCGRHWRHMHHLLMSLLKCSLELGNVEVSIGENRWSLLETLLSDGGWLVVGRSNWRWGQHGRSRPVLPSAYDLSRSDEPCCHLNYFCALTDMQPVKRVCSVTPTHKEIWNSDNNFFVWNSKRNPAWVTSTRKAFRTMSSIDSSMKEWSSPSCFRKRTKLWRICDGISPTSLARRERLNTCTNCLSGTLQSG